MALSPFLSRNLVAAPLKTPTTTLRVTAKTALATTFRVDGDVAKAGAWNIERLRRELPREVQTLRYTLKGQTHTAQCVPLLSLIKAAQPKFDAKTKHPESHFLVWIQGRDGYSVLFSLSELMPEVGKRQVYIALDADGKPLPDKEAPIRLIVPADQKPARWLYGVVRISLVKYTR